MFSNAVSGTVHADGAITTSLFTGVLVVQCGAFNSFWIKTIKNKSVLYWYEPTNAINRLLSWHLHPALECDVTIQGLHLGVCL